MPQHAYIDTDSVMGDFHDDLVPLGRMFIHVDREESTWEAPVLERE